MNDWVVFALQRELDEDIAMNCLITTDMAAKEYAIAHIYKNEKELNSLYQEGLNIFQNMDDVPLFYRKLSMNDFRKMYIIPMILQKSENNRI